MRTATRRPTIGLLAALIALMALVAALAGCDSTPTYRDAEPGQCVKEGSAQGNDMAVVDCDDPTAKWVVIAQVDSAGTDACADQPDADIVITDDDGGTATCLRFQAAEGDCAWQDLSGLADCEEDSGLQLAAILTGASDDTDCPAETTQSRIYSDGVVYCWIPHTAGG